MNNTENNVAAQAGDFDPAPKYEYSLDGKTVKWTNRDRMPKVAAQAGDEPMPCPECANEYLAVRTDIHKDGREFVYCDVCGCMAQKSIWNRVSPRATADVERDAERWQAFRARDDFDSLSFDDFQDQFRKDADRIIDAAIATTKPGA